MEFEKGDHVLATLPDEEGNAVRQAEFLETAIRTTRWSTRAVSQMRRGSVGSTATIWISSERFRAGR